jgi:hypothetical protein
VIHIKVIAQAIHNIKKKSDKHGSEFKPIFELLIRKLS